jgi:hypothetical protein
VQPAASGVDTTVEDGEVAVLLERRHYLPQCSKVIDIQLLVLPPEAVLRDKKKVRSCGAKLVEGENMGRPDIGNLILADVDVASRPAPCIQWARQRLLGGRYRLVGEAGENPEF